MGKILAAKRFWTKFIKTISKIMEMRENLDRAKRYRIMQTKRMSASFILTIQLKVWLARSRKRVYKKNQEI